MEIYVVRPGDTVDQIAAAYGADVGDLVFINQIAYPYRLAVGQAILIPDGRSPGRTILTNGYAYPFIEPALLRETLPYLSRLSIFSYGFTSEGQLLAPELPDEWMITAAWDAETAPMLTLTPLGPDGRFSNQLIHQILTVPAAQDRLIAELLWTLEQKGFAGVDVDFEYVLPEDRDRFSAFVERLKGRLAASGYLLTVALAPKTSADQKGLLYEGKDYGRLGAEADQVLLMTYEWGYKFGPPMAVAPLPQVRRVAEYAVTEIPAAKVMLGIPNYGYDWPLPFERGVTVARTIGNVEAVEIAVLQGVPIRYDETAQAPWFSYSENGVEHVVWFEDVRSIQAKFDLIRELGLVGAGYWQLMRPFRANWRLLWSEFWVVK